MKSYIAFVAGRSGGHILPALALAQQEKKVHAHIKIIFFTTASQIDKHVLSYQTYINYLLYINLPNFPHRIWRIPWYSIKCLMSFFRALWFFIFHRPYRLISTGGYISIPVACAAWVLCIPIELYELNALPGKTTLFLKYFASKIHCIYEQALPFFHINKRGKKSYPLLFNSIKYIDQTTALNILGWTIEKKTIFVLGGSQGSSFINTMVCNYLFKIKPTIQVIHQTGLHEYQKYKMFYELSDITHKMFDYEPDLSLYYQASDIIICRAGAGTLAEIIFFKKSAIVIPLETATTNHQLYNALEMRAQHPTLIHVIEQKHLEKNPEVFKTLLVHLLHQANFQAFYQNQTHSS